MMNFADLASAPTNPLAPFTDRLRLAVAAYLARFTGPSRKRTESDLRCYLIWCAERVRCWPGRGRRTRAADELGAAAYAINAARAAAPEGEGEAARRLECQWQRDQLPEAIRELVLDDQRLRNDICWSAFGC